MSDPNLIDRAAEKLTEALQAAWNDFCTDTGCHPDAFEQRGRKLYADFNRGNFTGMVAARLWAALTQDGPVLLLPAENCGVCGGSGWTAGEHGLAIRCPACGGSGSRPVEARRVARLSRIWWNEQLGIVRGGHSEPENCVALYRVTTEAPNA